MVYLAKKNGEVVAHTSKKAMRELDGIEKPDMEVTDAEYEAAGGLKRIINNKIFLGKTPEEKAAEEKEAQIQAWKNELAEIDKEAGGGRAIRCAALEAAKKAGVSDSDDVEKLQSLENRAIALRKKINPK